MINKLYKTQRNFSFDLKKNSFSTSSDLLAKSTKEKISKLKLHGNDSELLKSLRSAINIKKHSYNNKINNFYKNHLLHHLYLIVIAQDFIQIIQIIQFLKVTFLT